jgi:hypothetical protein
MRMSTKLIMATMTAAVLASPAMANSLRHAHGRAVPSATVIVPDDARGLAGPVRQGHFNTPFSQDCTHVAFPQCSGGN